MKNPEKDTKKQLEDCQKQRQEYLENWKRERADFLNYKKEEIERTGGLLKYVSEGFILKILPILDNFNLAEKKLPENFKKDDNVRGILQIKKQLEGFLKSQGVDEVKTVGERFDPNFHEVVEEIAETGSLQFKEPGSRGMIVEEIQKGYKINGRLLRPAKVKVVK
ncbi:MAG: nucleotide exchange factor GrpE [Candidatus Nealsonbacteria bacterium]|nr:nucleotide exchange factor GrpE [Candidatus Nealsonbacteria bacterium]